MLQHADCAGRSVPSARSSSGDDFRKSMRCAYACTTPRRLLLRVQAQLARALHRPSLHLPPFRMHQPHRPCARALGSLARRSTRRSKASTLLTLPTFTTGPPRPSSRLRSGSTATPTSRRAARTMSSSRVLRVRVPVAQAVGSMALDRALRHIRLLDAPRCTRVRPWPWSEEAVARTRTLPLAPCSSGGNRLTPATALRRARVRAPFMRLDEKLE